MTPPNPAVPPSAPASYTVDVEQLRSHAGRLAAHADELSTLGAALPGELAGRSLGSFAQFVATGLGAAMADTAGAFAHAASTVDKVGGAMRRAAEEYQNSDETHAAGLAALGPDHPEGTR
ncbi:WXG100 family type VII secretion target [Saccharomonospora piscinae]|uniref:type VII secretion target n=1 Tax=Saccharomonospora piscinae TaxID=687388 RepID=UPI00110638A3|nr:type VII secretion target [Saccharomonospora piscinae]TLW94738.1 WXG100 family type VII secretion target [Saccharomonospora piscinae]